VRDPKVDYTLVGGFVLAMLVAGIAFLAILAGRTGATDTYYTYYDAVTGVVPGTQLLYEGYRVGQVEEIQRQMDPETKRYRVKLSVKEGWKIPVDSVAAITEPGLLSAITIDIHAGESEEYLDPGGVVRGQDLQSVFTVVGTLAGRVEQLLVEDLQPLVGAIAESTPRILDDVEAVTSDLSAVSHRLSTLLDRTNVRRVDATIQNLSAAARSIDDLTQSLETSVARIDRMVESVDGLVSDNREDLQQTIEDLRFTLDSVARHVETINANLEATSHNMNEFSRQLRRNPGVLLRGTSGEPAAAGNVP
jgi:phospholipid/cholesterol/gamma-HCH transport system substrate-binding protein